MPWGKPRPAPPGAKEKVKLPNRQRGKLTSACGVCGGGTCRCKNIATADRAAAAKARRPIPCGQRFASGATCHYTVAPGERCPRDHSKH